MSDIVKICKNHGELTKDEIVYRNKKNKTYTECHKCVKSYHIKSYQKQKILHNKNLLNNYYETIIPQKKCTKHGELKPDQIQIRGKYMKCRLCMNYQCRKWEKNNKEKINNDRRKRYWLNPKKNSEDRVLSRIGLSKDQYYNMFEQQDYTCKICKKVKGLPISKCKITDKRNNRETLAIDHCHKTGKIRGLLCLNCNTILGLSYESIKTLENAIIYLKEFLND